jgi:DNA-binding CsgD family transcriptional regulator
VDENMDILTAQERKIVKIVLKGVSYPEAAKRLHISPNTLKTHMKSIFYKYNVNSKLELSNKLHIHA